MTIIQKYGWSFMDRYMANDPTFIQGHLGVVRAIASGQKVATFDMMVHHTMEEKSEGNPIAVAFPASDALPVWGQPGGIIRDAPHPNAAKLWLDWYMDPAQQRRIGTWSARTDVPPPFGLKPIFRYAVATNLLAYVGDQPKLDALRKRFVGYTGEVKNQGGIQ
jgi:ABC-type Fe3+ transport system substrate-binding protein